MNRTRFLSLTLVLLSLFVAAPAASAKTIAALPDLVVKKVSKPPATKAVGSKLRMVVQVQNAGVAKAGKSKLGLYLGKGKKHTKKDKRLKRVKVKPLAAGKTKKVKLGFTLPAKTKAGVYRLFACADDTRKVDEAKERNCKATRKLKLIVRIAKLPTPSALPPAPAFTMSDGIDWGFIENAQEKSPQAGEPVTLNLTAANGLPGQAGYTRSGVPSEGFRGGNATVLDFGTETDDGQVTRSLPFAFPFGGIKEQTISVSTNGWVSFGAPAWDYWDDNQPDDYRGIQAVVGEFYRGLMPYWADLDADDLGAGPGFVREVVAPDLSWVAYQWEVSQHNADGLPRRNVQLVLFADGRFRFDYPGENATGGEKSLVGYSLGTGAASADIVSAEGTAIPPSGLLFTPNPLPATSNTAAGEMTATLPKGSSLSSAPGCTLTAAPGPFNSGLVTCPVAGLGLGEQATRTVTFLMAPNAPDQSAPANSRLLGSYLSGSSRLTDGDEVNTLSSSLRSTTITLDAEFTTSPLEVGMAETIEVDVSSASGGGLDEPGVRFELERATLSSIKIAGETIDCTPPSGGTSSTCALPSGTNSATMEVIVIPSAPNVELRTTAQALNAPPATLNVGFIG